MRRRPRNGKGTNLLLRGPSRGGSNPDELLDSVDFFWRLTGIPIRGNGSSVGLLANKDTDHDLKLVQAWCKENCDRIYWDEKEKVVKLRGR